MPRTKPIIKPDLIGNLDCEPVDSVITYNESLRQEQFYLKPPNWDSAGESNELLFISNKRENDEMLMLQKQMEDGKKVQMKTNTNRVRKMCHQQKFLRQRFVEVNSFVKDCEDKKRLAEKKVNEEIEEHKELRKNIAEANKTLTEMTKFREVLKSTSDEYIPYELILQDLVKQSDIFESIEDCTSRCDALMLAQDEIVQMDSFKLCEIEEMRKRMVDVTNTASLEVLGLKNELAELERSYARAKTECLKWEKILATAKSTVESQDLNTDRSLDGIQTIYRMLCKRRFLNPSFLRHEVERQLDFIKAEFEVLNAVVEKYNTKKRGKSNKGFKINICD